MGGITEMITFKCWS